MKRTFVLLLCLALILTLFVGCQSSRQSSLQPGDDPTTESPAETEPATTEAPRPLTAEEILEAALERLRTAEALTLDLRGSFLASVLTSDEEYSYELELELPGELTMEPRVFRGDGTFSMAIDDEEKDTLTFSLCLALEEDGLTFYFRSGETEPYQRTVLSDGKGEGQTNAPSLTAIDWELEAGEDSYLLTHTVTSEEAERIWSAARRDEDVDPEALEELGLDADLIKTVFLGMKLLLTVDRETMELREASVDLSEGVKCLFDEFIAEELDGTEEDVTMELKELRVHVSASFSDYDEVTPFGPPEDYEDRGDLSDLLLNGLMGVTTPDTGAVLESLDDSYGLEDYAFRLGEITPRDIVAQGWVVNDAISMEGALSEDGIAAPGALVQLYLKQEGHEEDAWNSLRLGVVNDGEEAADYLDCPICFFSVNEAGFYEQSDEGTVDFSGPGGIRMGMDRDQITALLGEPYFESAGTEALMKCIYYYTTQGEALALLMDQNGLLKAMFYQDYARYNPSSYVIHN